MDFKKVVYTVKNPGLHYEKGFRVTTIICYVDQLYWTKGRSGYFYFSIWGFWFIMCIYQGWVIDNIHCWVFSFYFMILGIWLYLYPSCIFVLLFNFVCPLSYKWCNFCSRHPEVKWAQRVDKVFITVLLPDAKDAKVNLDPEGVFTFSASAGAENHVYELKLDLFDKVNVEVSGYLS